MNQNISHNISRFREQKNISYSDILKLTGITEEQYKKFEFGLLDPSLAELELIAKLYGKSPSDFLTGTIEQPSYSKQKVEQPYYENVEEKPVKYNFKKKINIISLSFASVFLILYFIPLLYVWLPFPFTNGYNVWISFFDLFSGSNLYVLLTSLIFLGTLWNIVSISITLVSKKLSSNNFMFFTKLFSLISVALVGLTFILATMELGSQYSLIMLLFIVAYLIVNIALFVKHPAQNN